MGLLGFGLFATGSIMGLFVVPPEQHMGDVGRILYVHVPTAWNAMLAYSFALIFAVVSLWGSKRWADATMTSCAEIGTLLNSMLLVQGSVWAKPTWGIWWTWDPRLTMSAVMLVVFLGVLVLRSFVDDSSQRATWSALGVILAWAAVPITYFSVEWWRSMHQELSTPPDVDDPMVLVLRMNAFALLFIATFFVVRRTRMERARLEAEDTPMPERMASEGA